MGRPTNNQKFLREIMRRNDLTRPQVADALCVNLSTVDRWLIPTGGSSYRAMPKMAVKLLAYIDAANDFPKGG